MALLEVGAEVDVCDEEGSTPLMDAAASGYLEVVQLLLEHGANPKHKDRHGNTSLAAAAMNNHPEVCDVLLPLSIPKEREKARIALDIHAQGGIDERVDALILAATRGQEEIVQDLVSAGVLPDAINAQGKTALMRAANKKHLNIVKWLLEQGANVNRLDVYGECPLSYAAMGCHPEMYDYLYQLSNKKLQKRGEIIRQNQIDVGNWPNG